MCNLYIIFFLFQDITGKVSIDFKDPQALRILTKCLLKSDFNLDVVIPEDCLVPTLPLRLNYILWIEDLMNIIKTTETIWGLDIGKYHLITFASYSIQIQMGPKNWFKECYWRVQLFVAPLEWFHCLSKDFQVYLLMFCFECTNVESTWSYLTVNMLNSFRTLNVLQIITRFLKSLALMPKIRKRNFITLSAEYLPFFV